ncbi:MAG TPA: ATP-binding protein [Thermoanaerobaculia bacterium]
MSRILIVDDRPINRQYLMTLLGYSGHELLEAGDGAEALAIVRNKRPDLVIADILMPTMDGYEFVARMRKEEEIAATPVIFYTATYRQREARFLAESCGVQYVLTKPAEPLDVLNTVSAALNLPAPVVSAPIEPATSEFTGLLGKFLLQDEGELEAVNLRMAALIELGLDLASIRTPVELIESFCHAARDIIASTWCAVGVLELENAIGRVWVNGLDELARALVVRNGDAVVLRSVVTQNKPYRIGELAGDPTKLGFPSAFPIANSFLAVPMATTKQSYGWLMLADKIGARAFTAEEERIAMTLASQVAIAFENLKLYTDIQKYTESLEREIQARRVAQDKLVAAQQELERRVEERTADLESERDRLEKAKIALESTNRELEAFSYSVSHDLRAPLRAIDGFSRILVDRYQSALDEKGRDYLARIRQATQRMGELIDDLLKLSQISRSEFRGARVDLSAIAHEIVDELRRQDPGREARVAISATLVANGDETLLRAALQNLIGNAWKFTSKKPVAEIELAVEGSNSERAFCIRDNGAGFDMKYAGKLFAPFQRLHSEDEFEGTGIGLATVQRAISRHGGRVWAESTPGRGARFFFTLPSASVSHE